MRSLSITAILSSALLLSGCAVIPSQEKEPIVAGGNSQFTKDGIEAMKASRKVSFDFTSLPVKMAALGLDDRSDGAMVATDTDKRMKVAMATPNGVVEMETDTIRVRGGGVHDNVDSIDIFVNYPDAQDANQEIKRAADELGFVVLQDAEPIGPEFKDGTGKETWNPGYGNAMGTVFALSIMSNHTTGRMTFIYTAYLSEEYYSPEARARIADTGKF